MGVGDRGLEGEDREPDHEGEHVLRQDEAVDQGFNVKVKLANDTIIGFYTFPDQGYFDIDGSRRCLAKLTSQRTASVFDLRGETSMGT